MNLSDLYTTTTVEFSSRENSDLITIDGKKNAAGIKRVIGHLDRIRKLAKTSLFARVVSNNSFPASAGLSSSASGFAALTLASATALGLNLSLRELSVLSRLASGSACRSIPGGFTEWQKGTNHQNSYAINLFPAGHWPLLDIVAVVSLQKKAVPTTVAQKSASTSPFFSSRLKNLPQKINRFKNALARKNFPVFAEIVEAEALELHAVIMTQNPSYLYLFPETVYLIREIRQWRHAGLPVYFTLNTGHDVHLLCQEKDKQTLLKKLASLSFIKRTIINYPAGPAKIIDKHLF